MTAYLGRILRFYIDGFRNLSWWGKRMWIIILIKIFIIFAILKVFFFRDFLGSRFKTNDEKGNYVMEQLINPQNNND